MTKNIKIKVGDLAKELNITVKDLVKSLKDLGVEVKTAASSIDEETAKIIRDISKPAAKVIPETPVPAPVVPIPSAVPTPAPVSAPASAPIAPKPSFSSILYITGDDISVKDMSDLLQVRSSDIIKELMKKSILATLNQRISSDLAIEVAATLGRQVEVKKSQEKASLVATHSASSHLLARPPIVVIMGHVDHGKTKLLDAIRKTKVAEGEAGGITQHIGAYQVTVNGKKITFLDTPGHEAFTALRARGAKVTDIAVLVVAADDGVMPQTVEAIDHAKAAGVPIMVAINKIDRPGANIERIKQQLSDHGLIPEDWGGKTIMVPTSAKELKGINELLEMILLQAEVLELKADPEGEPVGIVIESRLDKGRGPVASVLVQNGTVRVSDVFVCGATWGKIRALFSDSGARLSKAGPSTPIELLGCIDVPTAGDTIRVCSSDKEARQTAEQNLEALKKTGRGKVVSLEDFSKHIKEGEMKNLSLVVKADVQGSLDAIYKSLQDLTVGNIRVNIIHQAVGTISESDIMLAVASDAIVVGFNVTCNTNADNMAQQEGIEVRQYNIIYNLIDDVKLAMEGMLEPEYEEVVIGHAEVRAIFKFSKVGAIAGSFVKDGKMQRGAGMRVFRGKEKVFEGKLENLKRFKDDVKAVESNFECGISASNFADFQVGDIVEAFEIREKRKSK
ncbi:MAG: translation initiation factor IF-2 [Candidatus Margulisiibacteriota bacterium]